METVILYESDEAAQRVENIAGWVSNGQFFGEDENAARYHGCTHRRCQTDGCDAIVPKSGWLICEPCKRKQRREKYEALPIVEWGGEAPLAIFDTDIFFFGEDELRWYCDEHGVKSEDLMLVLCKESEPPQFSADDLLCDWIAEDIEPSDEFYAAVENLNKAAKTMQGFMYTWTDQAVRVELR